MINPALEKSSPLDEGDAARMKRDVARLVAADRVRLITDQPFLASLAMRLEIVPVCDAAVPTAATDGRSIFIDAGFMLQRTLDERLFIIAHEVWHCAALHFPRRGNREPRLWNIAIDHETNALLKQQAFVVPDDAVCFPEYRGLNAEEVYRRLEAMPEAVIGRGQFADVHDFSRNESDGREGMHDPDFQPSKDMEAWKKWPRRLHAAAQQHLEVRGSAPAWLKSVLKALDPPRLSWQAILGRYLERSRQGGVTWLRPNRRLASQGLILPGRRSERLRAAVVIDSSGSTVQAIPGFLSELRGILRAFGRHEVRVIVCDAAVHSETVWTEAERLPDAMQIEGGGGSDLGPAFGRLDRSPPDSLMVFTDGLTAVPERSPEYPVIWCLPRGGQAPAPWGHALAMEPA